MTFEPTPWGGRPARYATPLTPGLANRGAQVAFVGRVMGRPLLPHQRQIADVTTQLNPPGSHLLWRYQTVVLLLPRQTGKTTLLRPILVDRAQMQPRRQILTTAQLGKDAAARWRDLVDDIESGPLEHHVRVKRGNGQEIAVFPNRSIIAPFAPGPTAGHGYSPETILVDEGWSFSLAASEELMTGLRPSLITKRDRQIWIISAEGTKESEWLISLVDAGRKSVNDPNSKMAYFEWSADIDADPYDPATWEFHPGLDGLITIDDLREESKPENNSHSMWLRNYLNRRAAVESTLLDLDAWDRFTGEQTPPKAEQIALAYDVAIDRTMASVWTAWRTPDGVLDLHVYETREGADWLPDVVYRAWQESKAALIGADDGGPARAVTDKLRRAGVPVETLGGRDAATAWGAFKATVADSAKALAEHRPAAIRHDGSAALRDALEFAAERRTGDLRALDRSNSAGPIDAAIAAVTAGWFADRITGPQLFI